MWSVCFVHLPDSVLSDPTIVTFRWKLSISLAYSPQTSRTFDLKKNKLLFYFNWIVGDRSKTLFESVARKHWCDSPLLSPATLKSISVTLTQRCAKGTGKDRAQQKQKSHLGCPADWGAQIQRAVLQKFTVILYSSKKAIQEDQNKLQTVLGLNTFVGGVFTSIQSKNVMCWPVSWSIPSTVLFVGPLYLQ